ncbi:dnaJ homolog subfamily B member 13-like [Anoplophora glabripennis]|uniref:dnaJ homolog subfamily B member 13-like n=1 Tax=Anoplophora glabripennis TaxID=217634 RepID=UPI0008740603|nr:dnaJ homolog subfamily B member 13-like [Anoplophora glabripennis]
MGVDYYGILQIPKNSTDLQIKKAYRNLALEFNPEILKNDNAKQVFRLIGEAYDVLSDPLRRAVFDQYGEEGLKRGIPTADDYIPAYHYHGDPMQTYKDFFGTVSPYADLLNVLNNPPLLYKMSDGNICIRKKQPPIKHPLALTLHEIFFGGVKKMKIHRLVFIDNEHIRTEVKEKILSIPIKPGIRSNTEIILPEEGDQNPTQIPADIIFITEDRPHEIFTREGDDLIMVANISLEEALLGTMVTVVTIDHRTVRVPITDVVFPGFEKIVENEGMPILEKYPEKGNLIIRFNIDFPNYLPKNSKELLKKGFQMAKVGGGVNQHEIINKLVLADKILRVDPDERLPPI